jgi:hypothetical protein
MAQLHPDEPTPEPLSPLEQVKARRAARKAAVSVEEDAARAADLDAIDALEVEHGDSNVSVVHVPYVHGMPTCAAVRCPKPAEVKRYQSRCKPKHEKDHPDTVAAAEELAAICRIFPADKEAYAALCAARPGLVVQLGVAAIRLGQGKSDDEGKD